MRRLRLAILISGRGSNMATLLEACRQPDYPATPVLVLSSRPDAAGLEVARAHGIEAVAIDHKRFGKDRAAFEEELNKALVAADTEMIALAGFMRVLTAGFVDKWAGRMVNIHPSLLPKYPGLNTHSRALEAGDAEHGCSVHWVTAGVDEGDVIAQARIAIKADDTPETLSARLLVEEHKLYPRALALACERLL